MQSLERQIVPVSDAVYHRVGAARGQSACDCFVRQDSDADLPQIARALGSPSKAMRMPTIAITTSNSTSVNAGRPIVQPPWPLLA